MKGKTYPRRKLTPAQFLALKSAVERGSPTAHLSGQSAWGGWGGTREALIKRGYLDSLSQITELGRTVYNAHKGLL